MKRLLVLLVLATGVITAPVSHADDPDPAKVVQLLQDHPELVQTVVKALQDHPEILTNLLSKGVCVGTPKA